jgi:hypothetical protein
MTTEICISHENSDASLFFNKKKGNNVVLHIRAYFIACLSPIIHMIASAMNSRFKVLILEEMLDKKLQKGPFTLNRVISRSDMIFISFANENGTASIKTVSWK